MPEKLYKGFTTDLKDRLTRHNRNEVIHTAKFGSWELIFYAAFASRELALDFEHYLKSGSGIAFMRKRFIK